MSTREVEHPVFARVYALISALQARQEAPLRRELLAGLSGRVVEPGAGTGVNFAHYPAAVTEVVAVEPEPTMRKRALRAASSAPVPVRVVEGLAGAIPAPDASFDAAVVSMMLCSVDQPAVLAELRRVLRPGGELRFYEHVAATAPRLVRLQRTVAPLWARVFGGCRIDRDTLAAIEAAGFEPLRWRRFNFAFSPLNQPVKPHLLGAARRP